MDLLAAAGCIGIAASGCYLMYSSRANDAKMLQQVKYVDLDEDFASRLANGKSIDYAAVKGDVYPENQAIRGKFSSDTFGVASNVTIREYSSKYSGTSRSWYDQDKLISSADYGVPFKLVTGDNTPSIRVVDAKYAKGLTLEAVHEHFEPAEAGNVGQYLIDWFRGYQLRGIQTVEKMLKVGTTLTGIGQIVISTDGEIQLQPPKAGSYYLTRDTLDTLAAHVASKAKIWRNICIALAVAASAVALYALYKKHQGAAEERERIARVARQRRDAAAANQNTADTNQNTGDTNQNASDDITERQCVVCMTNERDVVLLQCGHVCVCSTCVPQLTMCPICRQLIDRIVLMYRS